MARSDETEWWFNAVYTAVRTGDPHGLCHKLRSYCSSAGKVQVGVCLKHLPSCSANVNHFFHDANVPWQRVINAKGIISPRGPGGAGRQAAFLRREGVTVGTGHLGRLTVDLGVYGWFPELLPSEAAESSESEDEASG